MADIADRLIVLAGATSPVGHATTRALRDAGARVVAVGRNPKKLPPLADLGARVMVCDLTDPDAVADLAAEIHEVAGPIDGLLPLVGGWRGGGGIVDQTDADYRWLERPFTALRSVSRAFDADLQASTAGRLAIISSSAVGRPMAGGANYAAVKAASEAWTRAVAQGFAKAARQAELPLRAAATVFRVSKLEGMETQVAEAVVDLWDSHPRYINDRIIDLG